MIDENEVTEEVEIEEPSDDINAELAAAWDSVESEEVEEVSFEAPQEVETEAQPESENSEPIVSELDQSPAGLSPEAREEWANTPTAIKEHIARNEQRMEGLAQKFGANAKRAESMDRSLAPYAQLFAMNGGAGNTLPGLLQTASQLQMGSGPQKAQAVAQIIKQFGVDIRALDSMLVGEAPSQESQQQSQVQQAVQQAVAPYQQQMQQFQQQQQFEAQQAQSQIAGEVNDFGSQHEFYNDVRSEMADLLDMSANRGRSMSMEEAYNAACLGHPQIAKILSARSSQQSVQKKQKASSSIYGTSGGSMSGGSPNSVEAALNSAWDNAGRM
tara:strand:- start:5474 stop:6460 length:987 start_codon:yes stop_codon:yes gene_type:complete